jgi:hypothetical protein
MWNVLISEDQLVRAMEAQEEVMKMIQANIKDEAVLRAIQKKLLLAIVVLVPEAGTLTSNPKK